VIARLLTEHFMIDAVEPGTKLYVRNKRPEGMKQFTAQKTLLFVHGATLPGEAIFDFPLEGLSWTDYIAQRGWDVYLVDVRGYGRSTRPPEMDQPAASNPPIATTDVAVRDVGSAIDFILQRRGVSKLSLVGYSWGHSRRAARKRWLLRRRERMLLCGQRRRRRFCERQARMTIRSRREVVTFKHPFRIRGIDRLLPAGAYEVVTDEETIEGLSFAAFRRVATMIKVPAEGSRGLAMEVVSIGPVDLSDAQRIDASISDG
jgi:hypothetical protein